MWTHFRKCTRFQDAGGKWYFLRFWDPRIWIDALVLGGRELARHLLSPSRGGQIDSLLTCDTVEGACIVVRVPTYAEQTNKPSVTKRQLTQADVEILRIGMLRPFAREIQTQMLIHVVQG